MDDFSWSDGLRAALRPCLSCFATGGEGSTSLEDGGGGEGRPGTHRTRSNDLEGLLQDVEDSDADAETLSLHSDIGHGRRSRSRRTNKKKQKKKSGGGSFFSYFRTSQPIQLPESDSETEPERYSSGRGAPSQTRSGGSIATSSSSASAFDSDARSLDAAAVERLTAEQAQEAAAREAAINAEVERRLLEERFDKAERRRSKMERRQLRRASSMIAMGMHYDDAGSPSPSPDPFLDIVAQRTNYAAAGYGRIPNFSHQQQQPLPHPQLSMPPPQPIHVIAEEQRVEDEDAHTDFGGEVYAVKARKSKTNLRALAAGNASDAGSSSSRSATTASSIASDPSAVAYQRFLALAALNGGQAALAAIPSPSTPALSLSPTNSTYTAESHDIVPPLLADLPEKKKKKKRRPETWIAPTTTSTMSSFGTGVGPEPFIVTPSTPPLAFERGFAPPSVSALGLDVAPSVHFQPDVQGKMKKKRSRMSLHGASFEGF